MKKKTQAAIATIIIIALSLTTPLFLTIKLAPVHAQTTNLTITGLVQKSLNLSLSDLQSMPTVTEYATLYCVDAPSTVLQQGYWTGVQLSYLLKQANVSQSAVKVAFYASDGFTTDLNVSTALQNSDILVAYQENNASLGGFRLVVPGCWGYKWISDLIQIQLVNYDFLGTEESQGYPDNGVSSGTGSGAVGSLTQITQPSPGTVSSPEATQNPTAQPANTPTSTASGNATIPAAASRQKTQGSELAFAAIGSAAAVACGVAIAFAVAKAGRKKAEAAKTTQADFTAEPSANPDEPKSGEV